MTLGFDDYRRHDALGLAAAVRRGDFSAAEVMQAALERLHAVNPMVGAVTWLDEALAERLCRAGPDPSAADHGPLAGVPYFINDLHAPVRGVPLRHGSRLFEGQVFDFDSETVARLRDPRARPDPAWKWTTRSGPRRKDRVWCSRRLTGAGLPAYYTLIQ
jgi:Asp-tRNA(Asn)/Glu-tRNA(Gln) amidotransferase A subunit family amidase